MSGLVRIGVYVGGEFVEILMWGTGFKVQGAGCRVQGAGCRVQGTGYRVQGTGYKGTGYRVQGTGCRVQGLNRGDTGSFAGMEVSPLLLWATAVGIDARYRKEKKK